MIKRYCVTYFGGTGEGEDTAKTEARAEYQRRYHQVIMEGYFIMDHWRNGRFNLRPALVLLYFDTVIVGCLSTAGILAVLTVRSMRNTENLSENTRKLQNRVNITDCGAASLRVHSLLPRSHLSLSRPLRLRSHRLDGCSALAISLTRRSSHRRSND
ncbi:hypothetical protein PFISCL1PPCAC_13992 [Pristionchus fissidentatus]|uniref:G protein-coupled receptor n=1 Tax=Pristionchus fissidentatus TaxID=1538716 RepID=A0AAV5VXA3_9BILA|nr:hypothetical protein PFISCL1PPCAC_13992 [Pristionchus fissidentatus]